MKPEINTATAETVKTGGDQAVVQERLVRFCRFMEWLWYSKLCPQPDRPILGSGKFTQWLYNFTARRASFWHRQTCERCAEKHRHRKANDKDLARRALDSE